LAALRAGLELADRADRATLLDVARHDPNPLAQSLAVRALGPIADAQIVLALVDLFATADEGLRQAIVDAWGHEVAASAGGLHEVIRVAENDAGAPAIEAASVLLRFAAREDAAAIGTRTLVQAIGRGVPRNRTLAIADAPLHAPAVVDALRKAAKSEESSVRAAALARLSESPDTRPQALLELWAMQKAGLRVALLALARAGVPETGHLLEDDLSSKDEGTRLSAMRALVGLGQLTGAADLLADDDARVRMTTSCTMLAARR
jgi:HEAT repeat protein